MVFLYCLECPRLMLLKKKKKGLKLQLANEEPKWETLQAPLGRGGRWN